MFLLNDWRDTLYASKSLSKVLLRLMISSPMGGQRANRPKMLHLQIWQRAKDHLVVANELFLMVFVSMSWTLAHYQVTSSCECSYVIYGACSIYLLDLFLFPCMWAWYHLLSLDGRTPCLLPSSLPHHCCFLYICPDMKVHCSTAPRWPDNVGLAWGRRVLLGRRRPPSYL